MAEMVRVNTRVSKVLNDWLDQESERTGTPKSTLVMLALENFYREREVMKKMTDMETLIRKIEELQQES